MGINLKPPGNPFLQASQASQVMPPQISQPIREQSGFNPAVRPSNDVSFGKAVAAFKGNNAQQPQPFDRAFLAQAKVNNGNGLSNMPVGEPLGNNALNGVTGGRLNLAG